VQGGVYASPQAAAIVEELRGVGFVGVGQSSWGSTIFGFGASSDDRIGPSAERVRQRLGLAESSIVWTKGANQGARIWVET
jgi:predicted sugar kinase